MARVVFIGAYAYAQAVLDALPEPPVLVITNTIGAPRQEEICWPDGSMYLDVAGHQLDIAPVLWAIEPDLVIVAGWRRLVPTGHEVTSWPTVGFHSAKLPEYPGRAPVANAILRGDPTITNTMLWLEDGIDSGDIIDEWEFPLTGRTPDDIYGEMGATSAAMLLRHWDGLLDGTAPRRKQDPSKRGPLTPADAWERLP